MMDNNSRWILTGAIIVLGFLIIGGTIETIYDDSMDFYTYKAYESYLETCKEMKINPLPFFIHKEENDKCEKYLQH